MKLDHFLRQRYLDLDEETATTFEDYAHEFISAAVDTPMRSSKVRDLLLEIRMPLCPPSDAESLQQMVRSSIRMLEHAQSTGSNDKDQLVGLLDKAVFKIKESHSEINSKLVQLIKLVELHKWRLRILFDFLDVDNSQGLTVVEFDRLFCLTKLLCKLAKDPGEPVSKCDLKDTDQCVSNIVR